MRTPYKKQHPNRRNLLVSRRVYIGLDQSVLALRASKGRRARLCQADISHYENGTRTPTHETAERIAAALGSNPAELFPDLYNTGITGSDAAGGEVRP